MHLDWQRTNWTLSIMNTSIVWLDGILYTWELRRFVLDGLLLVRMLTSPLKSTRLNEPWSTSTHSAFDSRMTTCIFTSLQFMFYRWANQCRDGYKFIQNTILIATKYTWNFINFFLKTRPLLNIFEPLNNSLDK